MRWWRRKAGSLPAHLSAALHAWRSLPEPDLDRPLADLRWVVVDTESSGLDPARDRLLSVGACAIRSRLLRLDETFEARLRQSRPSAEDNILLHGITARDQLAGEEPAAALVAFLQFLQGDVPVAFHAAFDAALIGRALRVHLGVKSRRVWFDAADIVSALFAPDGPAERSLDDWLARFEIPCGARHDALSDAVATAELILVAQEQAVARGIGTARELQRLCAEHSELRRLRGRRGWS
jgi:DNA polymerase-3 subunit epsilon